jgi:hypothetical protein
VAVAGWQWDGCVGRVDAVILRCNTIALEMTAETRGHHPVWVAESVRPQYPQICSKTAQIRSNFLQILPNPLNFARKPSKLPQMCPQTPRNHCKPPLPPATATPICPKTLQNRSNLLQIRSNFHPNTTNLDYTPTATLPLPPLPPCHPHSRFCRDVV